MADASAHQPAAGDPRATAGPVLELVGMQEPPLRLMLGRGVVEMARGAYEHRLDEWEAYRNLSEQAQGDAADPA